MRARLIDVRAPEWSALRAEAAHDVFDAPAYVELSAWHEGGEAAAVFVEDAHGARLLLPLIIREIDGSLRDARSPYGYPGVLTDRPNDSRFVRAAMVAVVDTLAAAGIVTLFVRLHPLLAIEGLPGSGTLVHQQTVTIDLSRPAGEVWAETRLNHKRDIRRARQRGCRFEMDASAEDYLGFQHIYARTMERLEAAPRYRFPPTYFDRLPGAMEGSLHVGVVRADGRMAAGGLFTEHRGIVQSFLIAIDDAFATLAPTKLLYHGAADWARARDDRWLHLGGGYGTDEDTLFHFKAGFSRARADFATLRIVVREDDYRSLLLARAPSAEPADLSGFFPAYREQAQADGEGLAGPGRVEQRAGS